MAAEEHGLEAAHVRLDELRLPSGPAVGEKTDDADWFMEHYLEADALIASTPIYTRALPGPLKVLIDRVLGPKLDVVMAEKALSSGEPFTIEEERSHSAELRVNAADGPDSDEVERHAGAYREYGRAARPQEVISEW